MIKLIVAIFVTLHVLTTRTTAPALTWAGKVAEAIFRPVIDRIQAVHDRIVQALEDAYKGVTHTQEQLFLGGGAGLLALWAVSFGGLLLHASGAEQVYLQVDKGCYVVTSSIEGCIVDAPAGDEGVIVMIGYLR